MTLPKNRLNTPYKRPNDFGIRIIFILFALATVIGVAVFVNYIRAVKRVTHDLSVVQKMAPSQTLESCAQYNINWYQTCDVMKQICDDTVSRMIKVCLVNGDKMSGCAKYGEAVKGYNFGYTECKPYLSNRTMKKVCADTWQAVADYCKASLKDQKG